jgi:hypothetical protein
MSKADEFRHYAEEAMRWARHSTSPKERLALINLARTGPRPRNATSIPWWLKSCRENTGRREAALYLSYR